MASSSLTNQTITFTSTAPSPAVGGPSYTVTATGGGSGNPVVFSIDGSSTPLACSIASAVVSFTGAGSCIIDANQAGNGSFNAAPTVQQILTVSKASQTVAFTSSAPAATVGGATYTPTGTGGASGNPDVFTIDGSSTGGCAIAAGHVSFTAAGSCVVDANQAGNANYNAAAQVQQTVTVGKGSQTVAFTSTAPAATVGGPTYTPTASGGASGNPVTFSIDGSSTAGCSISAGAVSFSSNGNCVIDANQAGNGNYNAAAQVQQTVSVGAAGQTVTFTSSAPAATVGGAGYTPTANGGGSGNPVVFTIDGASTGGCSISAGVVSFTAAGSCIIDANQAGNGSYNAAAQVQQTVTVGKASQTVAFISSAPAATVGGASYTPTGSGGASGNPVAFTIDGTSTGGACTISAGLVSFTGFGTCVIDANQAGTSNYNAAAQVQQNVSVTQGAQTISFTSAAPTTARVSGAAYTPTAAATSGLTVSFSIDVSSTPGACSLSAGAISFGAVGTCTVDANQSGNGNYNAAAQVQQSFTVHPASTVPGAPTGAAATSNGSQQVTMSWTAPASNGGAAITGYLVTSSPGGVTATTTGALTVTVTGLTNGQAYTFTVQAQNIDGYGPASAASNSATPEPPGYYLVGGDGGIFAFGVPFYGSMGGKPLNGSMVGITVTPDLGGYWTVAVDGGIFAFGDAGFYGSMGGKPLNKPVIGMQATPDGKGYWLVARDGGIFAFGDAPFYGSTGSIKLAQPIIRMAATPDGLGYWMVATDGGIFAFGDASFYGSLGGTTLAHPVISMASSHDGKGYWLVDTGGNVYSYGDATYYGGAAQFLPVGLVIGIAATPDGKGYWIATDLGAVYNLGDAPSLGGAGNLNLNAVIVGMAVG